MKVTLMLCAVLIMSGCSGLTGIASDVALGAVGIKDDSGLSVDTEIVVGDKDQAVSKSGNTKVEDVEVQGDLTTNTTGQETNVAGAENVTLNTGVAFWQAGLFGLVMFIAALFLPQFAIRKK